MADRMLKRFIMAAVGKVKAPISLERPPSATALGNKAQIRAFQTNSSPVYKTQSDTSLTNQMKGLTIREKLTTKPRRAFGTSSNGSNSSGPIKTLNDVANLLKNEECKNIVVVAGAGISTPSGIPDFRTPGTGLYDNLQQYRIPYPEAIFDIDYFHRNPKPFFTLAKELYPSGKYRPNYIHYLVRLLHDKGILLRMYTQNIDGLERLAGVPADKLVEAHGTFSSATCTICGHNHQAEDIRKPVFEDKLPKCKRRGCPGIVKPDIVFFGEDLPKKFYFYLKDMLQTDLVMILGTSLEVQPFAGIVDVVRWSVPRVLFNMTAVGPFRSAKRAKDVVAAGDMIKSVQNLSEMVGWKEEMETLITKHEGTFRVCDPNYEKNVEKWKQEMKKNPPPVQNAFWQKRNNFFPDYSDDSSDYSSSECTSSSEDETPRPRKPKFRNTWKPPVRKANNITPTRNGVNGIDSKNGGNKTNGGKGTRNYSTDMGFVSSRTDKSTSSKTPTTRQKAGTPNGNITGTSSRNKKTSTPVGGVNIVNKTTQQHRHGKPPVQQKMGNRIHRTTSEKNIGESSSQESKKILVQRPNSERGERSSKYPTKRTFNAKPNSLRNDIASNSIRNDIASNSLRNDIPPNSVRNDIPPNSVVIGRVPPSHLGAKNMNSDSEGKENQNGHATRFAAQNNEEPPKELSAVNAKPYGYQGGRQRKLLGRPTAPSNNINGSVNKNSDLAIMRRLFNSRSGSADIPKLTYRHRLQRPINTYDARIFTFRAADSDNSVSDTSDDSDESR